MLTKKLFTPAILGLIVVLLAIIGLVNIPIDRAEAAFVPTPASINYTPDNNAAVVRFWPDGTVLAASGASTAFPLAQAEALDIEWVLDQGDVNTATFKLQFSNNNSNWLDGANILADNAADATDGLQTHNMYAYTRVYVTLTNTNPLTVTHFSALPRR